MRPASAQRRTGRATGYTLLELMIAVAVVAILATIAFSAYRTSVLRAHRAAVRAVMADIAARLERERLTARQFPATIGFYVGNEGNLIALDRDGRLIAAPTEADLADATYRLTLAQAGDERIIVATAVNTQAQDRKCVTLSLSTIGRRTATPDNDPDCWTR